METLWHLQHQQAELMQEVIEMRADQAKAAAVQEEALILACDDDEEEAACRASIQETRDRAGASFKAMVRAKGAKRRKMSFKWLANRQARWEASVARRERRDQENQQSLVRLWEGLEVFDESLAAGMKSGPLPLLDGGRQSVGQSSGGSSDEGRAEGRSGLSGSAPPTVGSSVEPSTQESKGDAPPSKRDVPELAQADGAAAEESSLSAVADSADKVSVVNEKGRGKGGEADGKGGAAGRSGSRSGKGNDEQGGLVLLCGDSSETSRCVNEGHLARNGGCAVCKAPLHPDCGVRRRKKAKVCKPCAMKDRVCGGCSESTAANLTARCGRCYSGLHAACADADAPACRACVKSSASGSPTRTKTECGDSKAGFTCLGKNVLFRVFGSCTDCQAPLHRGCGIRVGDTKVCKECAGRKKLCGSCLEITDIDLEDRCTECKAFVHASCGCQEDGSTRCVGCSPPPASAGGGS